MRSGGPSSLLIDGPLFEDPSALSEREDGSGTPYAVHALSEHLFMPKRRRERALAPTTTSRTVEEVVLGREVAGGYGESAGYTHRRPKPTERSHEVLALPPVATSPALRRVGNRQRTMMSSRSPGAAQQQQRRLSQQRAAAAAADAQLQGENAELRRKIAALEDQLRCAAQQSQQRAAAAASPASLSPLDSMAFTPTLTPGPETIARESEIRAVEHARDVATLRLDEIDALIGQLNGAFIDDDQLIARWHQGATVINAAVRRFVVERRYRKAQVALRSWIGRRSMRFVNRAAPVIARLRSMHLATRPFVAKRERVYKHRCMKAWQRMHRAMQRVRGMADISWEAKMRVTIRAWHAVSKGPGSRRHVAERYLARQKTARATILRKTTMEGERAARIVTDRELQFEMDATATREIRAKLAVSMLQRFVNAWWDVAVRPAHAAHRHYCKALTRRCTRAWKSWVAGRAAEAGVAASARKERRDQLKLVGMMRSTNTRKQALEIQLDVVTEWRHWAHPRATVRRRERVVAARRRSESFLAWRVVAKRQHAVRALVIDEWKHAAQQRMLGPFRAWYVLTERVKKEKAMHQVIVSAWERRRVRSTKHNMFKHWEHMTMYGDVSSMKSRQEMILQIEEQRTYITALNTHIAGLVDVTDELELRLTEERALTDSHSKQRSEAQSKQLDYQHALKNVEEQYMVAQARLDALTSLHPGTMALVRAQEQVLIDASESAKLQKDLMEANLGKSTPDMNSSLAPLARWRDKIQKKRDKRVNFRGAGGGGAARNFGRQKRGGSVTPHSDGLRNRRPSISEVGSDSVSPMFGGASLGSRPGSAGSAVSRPGSAGSGDQVSAKQLDAALQLNAVEDNELSGDGELIPFVRYPPPPPPPPPPPLSLLSSISLVAHVFLFPSLSLFFFHADR